MTETKNMHVDCQTFFQIKLTHSQFDVCKYVKYVQELKPW